MLGKIVKVDFLDHGTQTGKVSTAKAYECTAYGMLVRDEPDFLVLCNWISDDVKDPHSEFSVVVKGPTTKVTVLGARRT